MFDPVDESHRQAYRNKMASLKLQNHEIQKQRHTYRTILRGLCANWYRPAILLQKLRHILRLRQVTQRWPKREVLSVPEESPNYFHTHRIAVYTCIIGGYETLKEPLWIPDNCDFYAITDQIAGADSVWMVISPAFLNLPEGLNPAQINRYCKMFPHKLTFLANYRYSVYLDGKVRPITDLTEFVNRIPEYGMAFHRHAERNCAYEEAEACRILKRDHARNLDAATAFLREQGFPEHYGLLECCCIARDHQNEEMRTIMAQWWDAYMGYTKRDQLMLPYILYRHQIPIEAAATLGPSVYANMAVRIEISRQ